MAGVCKLYVFAMLIALATMCMVQGAEFEYATMVPEQFDDAAGDHIDSDDNLCEDDGSGTEYHSAGFVDSGLGYKQFEMDFTQSSGYQYCHAFPYMYTSSHAESEYASNPLDLSEYEGDGYLSMWFYSTQTTNVRVRMKKWSSSKKITAPVTLPLNQWVNIKIAFVPESFEEDVDDAYIFSLLRNLRYVSVKTDDQNGGWLKWTRIMLTRDGTVETDRPNLGSPTDQPTPQPATSEPTDAPTDQPTPQPATSEPTNAPTDAPTPQPATNEPTDAPTDAPTPQPATSEPTDAPTPQPATNEPTDVPTDAPTDAPTPQPATNEPTDAPTDQPTGEPDGFAYALMTDDQFDDPAGNHVTTSTNLCDDDGSGTTYISAGFQDINGYKMFEMAFNQNGGYQYCHTFANMYTSSHAESEYASNPLDLSEYEGDGYLSMWFYSTQTTNVRVRMKKWSSSKKITAPVTLPLNQWVNIKIAFVPESFDEDVDDAYIFSLLGNLRYVSVKLDGTNAGTIRWTQITLTHNGTPGTTLPNSPPPPPPVIPGECNGNYEHFKQYHTEWAYLPISTQDGVDLPSKKNPGYASTDDTGTVYSHKLLWNPPGDVDFAFGYLAIEMDYRLPSSGYMYMNIPYRGDHSSEAVNIDTIKGTHFCFFFRSEHLDEIKVRVQTERTRRSFWVLEPHQDEKWHHHCLPWATLQTDEDESPVDFTSVEKISFKESDDNGRHKVFYLALMSMTTLSDDVQPYAVPPYIFDPVFGLRPDQGGECKRLVGPNHVSPVPSVSSPPDNTPVSAFAVPNEPKYHGVLAFLVLDTDTDWLSIALHLENLGYPFTATEDIDEAMAFSGIFVYPSEAISSSEEQKLKDYMNNDGGLVIFDTMTSDDYKSECGYSSISSRRSDMSVLRFLETEDTTDPHYGFIHYQERNVKIYEEWIDRGPAAYPISVDDADVIAVYKKRVGSSDVLDMNKAAITIKTLSGGGKCALTSFDYGRMIHRNADYWSSGQYTQFSNAFDPGLDMLIHIIGRIHGTMKPTPQISPIPDGRPIVSMYTHDCDAHRPEIWVAFSEMEREEGINGTYLMWTKITSDHYESPYFFFATDAIRRIYRDGHELASHSVAHSPNLGFYVDEFDDFPVGTGTEKFDYMYGYTPEIKCVGVDDEDDCEDGEELECSDVGSEHTCGLRRTYGGTDIGEIRVSKFLVDQILEDEGASYRCQSFRGGHLQYARHWNEILENEGILTSSLKTSQVLMTHHFYRHTWARKGRHALNGFNLGITTTDGPPLAGGYREPSDDEPDGSIVYQHYEIARQISNLGGIFLSLIHPSNGKGAEDGQDLLKVEYERDMISQLRAISSFKTMKDYGAFLRARSKVRVAWESAQASEVTVYVTVVDPIQGLTLKLPIEWTYSHNDHGLTIENGQAERSIVIRDRVSQSFTFVCAVSESFSTTDGDDDGNGGGDTEPSVSDTRTITAVGITAGGVGLIAVYLVVNAVLRRKRRRRFEETQLNVLDRMADIALDEHTVSVVDDDEDEGH